MPEFLAPGWSLLVFWLVFWVRPECQGRWAQRVFLVQGRVRTQIALLYLVLLVLLASREPCCRCPCFVSCWFPLLRSCKWGI